MTIHPIVEAILSGLPHVYGNVAENPFTKKVRAGWFNASELSHKPPTVVYDPSRCMLRLLGLAAEEGRTAGEAWRMLMGSAIDAIVGGALRHSGLVLDTQSNLRDADLCLSGTPDLLLDWAGEHVLGDVKSTAPANFAKWKRPEWDPASHFSFRQLQVYLMLSDTDWGFFLFVDRSRFDLDEDGHSSFNNEIADCFHIVEFNRDEKCIAGIRADLDELLAWLPTSLAAIDPDRCNGEGGTELVLQRLRRDPEAYHHLLDGLAPGAVPACLVGKLPPARRGRSRR